MVPKHLYFGHAALALVLIFALQSFAASGKYLCKLHIILFYTLWKKSRQKYHSTLEMDTFKVMLHLSYLASLDNKPRT